MFGHVFEMCLSLWHLSHLHALLLFCSLSEDGEEGMCQDTDSDVAEQRDCGKVKVKWTQEEVL